MIEAAAARERRPYLPNVASARNDSDGGDLPRRMQAWIDGIVAQFETFNY